MIEQSPKNKPACPHCAGTELYRWGKASEVQRYRCRQCNHTFNTLTGSPLARLRHKDKWLEFEQAMADGLSLRKSASVCGIALNTCLKWRHRFLQITATELSGKINDFAETGETNYQQSPQGQHPLPDPFRKRNGKAVKRDTPDK
ncbi:MAG: IS1 family transposase [Burkholderiales bacterium]|nr:IS1 family transposase [Nitrosomonas sp.]MCP5274118.1 IS1 family transposase [Burkholderiales bacterium]